MDVRVLALIVKRGVPAEILRRNLHRRRDVVAVGADKVAPRRGAVIAQTGGVLPAQGNDVRPDVSGIGVEFLYGFFQIDAVLVPEQAV